MKSKLAETQQLKKHSTEEEVKEQKKAELIRRFSRLEESDSSDSNPLPTEESLSSESHGAKGRLKKATGGYPLLRSPKPSPTVSPAHRAKATTAGQAAGMTQYLVAGQPLFEKLLEAASDQSRVDAELKAVITQMAEWYLVMRDDAAVSSSTE